MTIPHEFTKKGKIMGNNSLINMLFCKALTLLFMTDLSLAAAPECPTHSSGMHHASKAVETTIKAEIFIKGPLVKGNKTPTELELLSKESNKPLLPSEINVTHTEIIHLLIFDKTLTDYQHVHPIPTDKPGIYRFEWTPKEASQYKVWVDLTPLATNQQEYIIADLGNLSKSHKEAIKVVNLTQNVDGLTYNLSFDSPDLNKGKTVMGKVLITDAKGHPFTQLEPIMGTFAHIVAINQDFKSIAHIHPMGKEPSKPSDRGGPELDFHMEPDKSGFWKIWVQVKIKGKEVFVPFGVNVK